jgi:uncharacterized protein (TIGR02453 family)
MPATKKGYFTRGLLRFLRELAKNNNRTWFGANKARFEEDVRDPLLEFIRDFGAPLARISPHYVSDPRPVGGSLFRIYRDTRFSKDKTPYKTNMGAQFNHVDAAEVHAPGYYLHLDPAGSFACAGVWHPEPQDLEKIRRAIVDAPEKWRRILKGKKLCGAFGELEGESLTRPPRGYDPAHPLIDDLKRKDFIVTAPLTEDLIVAADFMARFVGLCRTAAPLLEFLTRSVGLPF